MGLSRTVRLTERFQAAGQYVHNRLTGRPTSLTLEITKRCNATCDFCPYWEADEVDEVKDFTPAIRYFQPLHVSITGGEPFLRKDLLDIVRQVKSVPGFRYIGLYTNGWLLNEKRVEELTAAGVNQIQISLQWPTACLVLRRATRGRRPQSPGNQSRRARFWKFPPGDSLSRIAGDRRRGSREGSSAHLRIR